MVVHADNLKTCYSDTPTTSLEPTDDFELAETVTPSPAQPDEQQTNVSQSGTPEKRPIKSRAKRQVEEAVDNLTLMLDWMSMLADRNRPSQTTAQGAEVSGRLSALVSYPCRPGTGGDSSESL